MTSQAAHKATIQKELHIETPNQAGTAGKLTALLSKGGSHIESLWSGVMNNKGFFAIITDNNKKASQALQQDAHFNKVQEMDVIVVPTTNRTNAIVDATGKLGTAGIDIEYFYTTTLNNQPVIIISTKNNQKAADVLSH